MSEICRKLYDIVNGGGAAAFQCGVCGSVTHTWRGFKLHLWFKHKMKLQEGLDFDASGQNSPHNENGN
jgi:hypothetical protein